MEAARKVFLLALLAATMVLPQPARGQTPLAPGPGLQQPAAQTPQQDTDEVGNVANVQGQATVTRNGASQDLKVQDPIFKGDVLRTGLNATLGIIFDDESTFNLSANASIEVNEFIYESGGKSNSALFNIARGTVAFAANQVAKTGDMKISTPSSVLGIRGTSGVVEVPEGATPGTIGEVAVKLYQDEDGRVGRIELFQSVGGPRIGLLTRAASGFSLRAGAGGRFAAVPLVISAQQVARDRAFVQRTFVARNAGRQMIIQRRNLRGPGLQRPGLRQQNQRQNLRQPGGLPRGNPGPGRQGGARPQNQPGRIGTGNRVQQQNLQRQNLRGAPRGPAGARQPARRKPPNALP